MGSDDSSEFMFAVFLVHVYSMTHSPQCTCRPTSRTCMSLVDASWRRYTQAAFPVEACLALGGLEAAFCRPAAGPQPLQGPQPTRWAWKGLHCCIRRRRGYPAASPAAPPAPHPRVLRAALGSACAGSRPASGAVARSSLCCHRLQAQGHRELHLGLVASPALAGVPGDLCRSSSAPV